MYKNDTINIKHTRYHHIVMRSYLYSLFTSKKTQRHIEIGADNGDIYEYEEAIKSHKIHFDGDTTLPVNIEYVTVFGEKHGEYKLYDRAGKLMSFAQYNHGKLHGDTIDYNVYMRQHDGSMKIVPKYIRTYENGVEVSQK